MNNQNNILPIENKSVNLSNKKILENSNINNYQNNKHQNMINQKDNSQILNYNMNLNQQINNIPNIYGNNNQIFNNPNYQNYCYTNSIINECNKDLFYNNSMNNNNYNSNINNTKILIDNDLQINNIDNQNRKNP